MKKVICSLISILIVLTNILNVVPVSATSSSDMPVVVSLGDSFSSGEGIEPYYGQSNDDKYYCEDWIAHRSTLAWAGLLEYNGVSLNSVKATSNSGLSNKLYRVSGSDDGTWYFGAVSGAKTENVLSKSNGGVMQSKTVSTNVSTNQLEYVYETYTYSLDYQIDTITSLPDDVTVDYVTMTIGGNDVGFTAVIKKSLGTGFLYNPNGVRDMLYDTISKFWDTDGVADKLEKVYKEILQEAPEATLVIAGYPRLIYMDSETESTNSLWCSYYEAYFINRAVAIFDNYIEEVVDSLNTNQAIYVDVKDAFSGHEAGADDAYINGLIIIDETRENVDLTDATGIFVSNGSMHPNAKGAQAYASAVQEALSKIDNGFGGYLYNTTSSLNVYDVNSNLYDNYTIEITGEEYHYLIGTINPFGLFNSDYSETIEVTSAEAVTLELPSGYYTIKIIDNNDASNYFTKEVHIRECNNKEINIYTNFESENESSDNGSTITTASSGEKDIVLVLDTSGSMAGTSIDETKNASNEFIETILEEDASIGIVTYSEYASKESDFSTNKTTLETIVNNMYATGGTNMETGLSTAYTMLEKSNAKKKIIVLMSDGMPNRGKVGDELIEYADSIKDDNITIYTLGFFSDVGSEKASCQSLMESIASDGCHYEVASEEDLVYFFEDIADQINGQKYIYARVACPVDVTITYNGETLSSNENLLNTRTSFGTLTFEETEDESDDQIKVIRLKEGDDYDISINGTGYGSMNYTIGFMDDDGNYSDFRTFENITITTSTSIDTVAKVADSTVLNVDSDGDGSYDIRYRAKANSIAEEVPIINWVKVIIIGVIAAIIIITSTVLVIRRRKRRKAKA